MSSLLERLTLTPAEYAALPSDACERILDFLLHWQDYASALACLDSLHTLAAAQVEGRAAALHGLGRTREAISLLEARTRTHNSLPAASQLVRLRLAAGEHEAAVAAARQLPGAPGALVLGDALLAAGALEEAEAVFFQLHKDAPGSRQALAGLMRVEQRRGDLVSACAHALRIIELARRGPELSVDELLALRAVLGASGDTLRVDDLNQRLKERYARDLADAKATIANARQLARPAPRQSAVETASPAHPLTRSPAPPSDWTPASPAAALSSVAVSARERSQLAQQAAHLFGYAKLLPGQAEVLACVHRREHVLAVMPTGAGKSLCYQLPAFWDTDSPKAPKTSRGVTVVVSPLVALMKDQIDGLPYELRRQAVAVNSSVDGDDLRRIVKRIAAGDYRLIYAAPERLRQLPFVDAVRAAGVERLVVDEAHCVSIWGHDFRPDYLHLAQAHADLGEPPVLAMTATAPPRVRHDIERQLLGAPGPGRAPMRVLVGDTFRPNLQLTALRVRDDEEQQEALVALLRQLPAPGIIYARSRKRCDELAGALVGYGVRAAAYHAGLEGRAAIQDQFMRDQLDVIVATVAFGMGVDKPNIRFIVHCGLPNSVEGYYQEIGRAGRDGQPGHCVLIYSEGEGGTLARLAGRDQLTEERVRTAYAALRGVLDGTKTGPVPLAQIAAAVQGTDTEARMLLGVLEQVGLIRRHYDAPQTLTIQRLAPRFGGRPDPALQAFCAAANLVAQTHASGDFAGLAAATHIPIEALEARLLAWQDEGFLRCYPAGRVPLISLLPQPADAAQRIESLLARRAAVAQSRVQEIDDYAHTRGCRHAFLHEHLGGDGSLPEAAALSHSPKRAAGCGACDNCGGGLRLPQEAAGGSAAGPSAADLVLGALAEQSWGRRSLIRLLRGDPEASERARESAAFGCLAERSEQSLGQLIDSLIGEGLIARRSLEHGGITLEATRLGLESLKRRPTPARAKGAPLQKPRTAYARWHKP